MMEVVVGRTSYPFQYRDLRQLLPNISYPRHGLLDPARIFRIHDPLSLKALQILISYLFELDRLGQSNALLDILERSWKEHKTYHITGIHRLNRLSPVKLFQVLSYWLAPSRLGCGTKIFNVLSTFFVRHCETMMKTRSDAWTACLAELDHLGGDMADALSCIALHWNLVGDGLQCRQRMHYLSPHTLVSLYTLLKQKRNRDHQRQIGYHTQGPHRGQYGGFRRGQIAHRHTHEPDVYYGDELASGLLEALGRRNPRRIKVNLQGISSLDMDDSVSIDSEEESMFERGMMGYGVWD